MEALQEMRISFRWDAINEENRQTAENKAARKRGEDVEEYEPEVFENGDTRKQLLARSRYLLFKSRNKWTESQKKRAKILFELYPDIENAYNLTDELRRIYSSTKIKGVAYTKLAHWYKHVEDAGYDSFQVVKQTIYENYIENAWSMFVPGNRVGGKRSSFLPTFVFRPLTPPYVRFRIRRFFILRAI